MNTLRKITQEELNDIVAKHELWLEDRESGKRANLSYKDLSRLNLESTTYAKDANIDCAVENTQISKSEIKNFCNNVAATILGVPAVSVYTFLNEYV